MTDISKTIANNASSIGIEKGDTLLIHTSFRSLGNNVTAQELIEGLRAAVGEEGTVMLPALSYMSCNAANPYFDYYETRSNIGYLPEYFRTEVEGVIRSLAPTHSCCAVGSKAEFLTSGHILDDTPCGKNSPFHRLMELSGKILFIGCGMRFNTSMHAIEELSVPDYLFGDYVDYTLKDKNGAEHKIKCRAHNFKGVAQIYERLAGLLEGDEHKIGNILSAECHLVETVPMWEKADKKYRQDPHYFIDEV